MLRYSNSTFELVFGKFLSHDHEFLLLLFLSYFDNCDTTICDIFNGAAAMQYDHCPYYQWWPHIATYSNKKSYSTNGVMCCHQECHSLVRSPCVDYHGGRRNLVAIIREYMKNKKNPFFILSMIGGDPLEEYPPRRVWFEDIICDDDYK